MNSTNPTGEPWPFPGLQTWTSDRTDAIISVSPGGISSWAPLRVSKIESELAEKLPGHGHVFQTTLMMDNLKIVAVVKCTECSQELVRRVLFKIPNGIRKSKCLPRMLKEVK